MWRPKWSGYFTSTKLTLCDQLTFTNLLPLWSLNSFAIPQWVIIIINCDCTIKSLSVLLEGFLMNVYNTIREKLLYCNFTHCSSNWTTLCYRLIFTSCHVFYWLWWIWQWRRISSHQWMCSCGLLHWCGPIWVLTEHMQYTPPYQHQWPTSSMIVNTGPTSGTCLCTTHYYNSII